MIDLCSRRGGSGRLAQGSGEISLCGKQSAVEVTKLFSNSGFVTVPQRCIPRRKCTLAMYAAQYNVLVAQLVFGAFVEFDYVRNWDVAKVVHILQGSQVLVQCWILESWNTQHIVKASFGRGRSFGYSDDPIRASACQTFDDRVFRSRVLP